MGTFFNTKANIIIKVKDYPVGKNLKCHIWFLNSLTDKEISEKLENIKLTETYKDYVVKEIKIVSTLYTNGKKDDENYEEIILDSTSSVYEGNPKKQKDRDNAKSLSEQTDFSVLSLAEIEKITQKLSVEMFKRKYNFNDKEYSFYLTNKDEVEVEKVKEMFEMCGGDVFKMRKHKIREKINDILNEKKVI